MKANLMPKYDLTFSDMPWRNVIQPELNPQEVARLVHIGTRQLLNQMSPPPNRGGVVTRGGLLMEQAICEVGFTPERFHPSKQVHTQENSNYLKETWVFDVIADTGATLLSIRDQLRFLGREEITFCCVFMTETAAQRFDTLGIRYICLETIGQNGFVLAPSAIPYDFGDITTYIGLA